MLTLYYISITCIKWSFRKLFTNHTSRFENVLHMLVLPIADLIVKLCM